MTFVLKILIDEIGKEHKSTLLTIERENARKAFLTLPKSKISTPRFKTVVTIVSANMSFNAQKKF